MTKFKARAVEIDGIRFSSQKEGRRYVALSALQRVGAISGLEVQPSYRFEIAGQVLRYASGLPVRYVADFRYTDSTGRLVVEDVKSPATRTPVYKLKAALMLACHGIKITET